MREWDNSFDVNPLRTVGGEMAIGYRDLEFSAGGSVLIDEDEAVQEGALRKRDNEDGLAFLKIAADGVPRPG